MNCVTRPTLIKFFNIFLAEYHKVKAVEGKVTKTEPKWVCSGLGQQCHSVIKCFKAKFYRANRRFKLTNTLCLKKTLMKISQTRSLKPLNLKEIEIWCFLLVLGLGPICTRIYTNWSFQYFFPEYHTVKALMKISNIFHPHILSHTITWTDIRNWNLPLCPGIRPGSPNCTKIR